MDVPLRLILDGATGTELQKRGMPKDCCTEQWILAHPEVLLALQGEYLASGSQLLLAPTFGANRVLLERFGLGPQLEDYNRRLVALTRQVADGKALVAGDMTTVGAVLAPFGTTDFEDLVGIYTEQATALERAGIDLFFVETMISITEARAAVLAIRAVSQKPIFVTFYCDDAGETPAGCEVLAALLVMQGMGVSAFGLGCTNPEDTEVQLRRIAPYANIPLIAKPCNRDDTVEEFAARASGYAASGVRYFGACCHGDPAKIAALAQAVEALHLAPFAPHPRDPDVIGCPCGKKARFITPDVDTGKTILCSPNLLEDILQAEEVPAGALKIAIWDEDDLSMFAENQYAIEDALCLTTDVPELLEGALRAYQGRAFWDGTEHLEDDFLAEMRQKYGLVLL